MRGALAAAGLLILAAIPAGQAPDAGTITGHVRLTTRVRGTALPSNVYQPRAVQKHEPAPIPEIRNVVVYVKGVAFHGPLPTTQASIRQENESFIPRVVAITRGSTVVFPNSDPFFHNVFSLSSAAAFNLGRYPRGKAPRPVTFARPGLVKVYCDIHSHMSASILVLDHPYFLIPELDGTFTLPDIPPGRHTIVGWHERVGERAVTVDVPAGKSVDVELSLPVEDPP
jgi:plastocyanin